MARLYTSTGALKVAPGSRPWVFDLVMAVFVGVSKREKAVLCRFVVCSGYFLEGVADMKRSLWIVVGAMLAVTMALTASSSTVAQGTVVFDIRARRRATWSAETAVLRDG